MPNRPDQRGRSRPKTTGEALIPGAFGGETITRRRLMTGSANAAGAIAVAAFSLPALGFAIGPVFQQRPATWQDIGALDEFNDRDFNRRVIILDPAIGTAGHSTAFVRLRNPAIDTEPADQYNQVIAITSRCAHVGCPVNFVAAAEAFVCPCHGGVYDFRGLRTGGPPPRPLDRFYTRIRDGRVQLGPRYSVNSHLRRFSPRDPGEALDGIGQYLYPRRFSTPPKPS
jgi:menaquinol-cytochrome c reductase iron-sulfur subunit